MFRTLYIYVIVCFSIVTFFCGCLVDTHSGFDNVPPKAYETIKKPIVAAYLHIGTRKIDAKQLDLRGVDIVNMAFTVITNNRVGLLYPSHADNFMIVRELKENNPNLKVIVSVGGYGTAAQFRAMASNSNSRAVFVDDVVRFLKYFGFDGIDVDWEFPGMEASCRNADRKNFTALISEMRIALDSASRSDGKKYMLTIAAGAFDAYLSYTEPSVIAPLVDYFFVMTYDFVGQWNSTTGHHTNLYASSFKKGGYSVDRIVKAYIKNGIPANKIVIGAAAYGRQWNQVQSSKNGLFVSAKGVGSVPFNKIVQLEKLSEYHKCWDKYACASYLFSNKSKTFISYDNAESVRRKVDYINIHSLGGIMYWEYFSDSNLKIQHSIIDQIRIWRGQYIMPQLFQLNYLKKM